MRLFFYKATIATIIVFALGGVAIFFLTKQKVETPAQVIIEKKETKPIRKVIGLSVEGREIESFTFGQGKKQIAFVGGIHGGYEWNSVILAYSLMDYIEANSSLIPTSISITIIPSANPDAVFKVVSKEGRFVPADVSKDKEVLTSGRFNAHDVDINRNFDCKWNPQSKWQSRTVSGGKSAFSEPETRAIRDYALENKPLAFVFWHSQADGVFASECKEGILPETLNIMNVYAKASGYAAQKSFESYTITGESADWLASIGIPAISVELKTHEVIEWDKNLAGVKALIGHYK